MVVNFVCQLGWAMGPNYVVKTSLDVTVKLFFLDEIVVTVFS